MRTLILLFVLAASAFGAGTVTQSLAKQGNTDVVTITIGFTGDASDGSVPFVTMLRNGRDVSSTDGYSIVGVETKPGGTAPTANWDFALQNENGLDLLAGACADRSASAVQFCSTDPRPINSALSIRVTGNSVNSATGTVTVFLTKITVAKRGGTGGGTVATGTYSYSGSVTTSGSPPSATLTHSLALSDKRNFVSACYDSTTLVGVGDITPIDGNSLTVKTATAATVYCTIISNGGSGGGGGGTADAVTGASNLGTVGGIPFVNSAGVLNIDATKLFWDNSGKRLLLGPGSADDSGILIARSISGSNLFSHGLRDESTFSSSTTGAYASFDAMVTMSGSLNPYNHFNGFQSRQIYAGSGSLGVSNGFTSTVVANGTVTSHNGFNVEDATGSGSVGTQTGLRIANLTKGSANYSIQTGSAPSVFGGNVSTSGTLSATGAITSSAGVTGTVLSATSFLITGGYILHPTVGLYYGNSNHGSLAIGSQAGGGARPITIKSGDGSNTGGSISLWVDGAERMLIGTDATVTRRIQLQTASGATCDSSGRFTFEATAGGSGVADTVKVCVKSSADTYSMQTILGGGAGAGTFPYFSSTVAWNPTSMTAGTNQTTTKSVAAAAVGDAVKIHQIPGMIDTCPYVRWEGAVLSVGVVTIYAINPHSAPTCDPDPAQNIPFTVMPQQ